MFTKMEAGACHLLEKLWHAKHLCFPPFKLTQALTCKAPVHFTALLHEQVLVGFVFTTGPKWHFFFLLLVTLLKGTVFVFVFNLTRKSLYCTF